MKNLFFLLAFMSLFHVEVQHSTVEQSTASMRKMENIIFL
jgi:phosphatidylserine decarboxylase